MDSASQEKPPQGRDEIPAALIAACERLCSSRPPSLVSVRDIAQEARVTVGLVHHYFESKDALVSATLRSMSDEIDQRAQQALEATGDPAEMVRAVWRFGQARPAFMMIVTWWAMEGRDVTLAMGDHPFMRSLAVALGAPAREEARTQTGVIVLMILAGNVMRVGMNRALGRDGGDQALVMALEEAVVAATRAALPKSLDPET